MFYDILILTGFGLLMGIGLSAARIKRGLILLATGFIGAVLGYNVVNALSQNQQLAGTLLSVQNLELVYESSGLAGVVEFARFFEVYAVLIGFFFSLFGAGLGIGLYSLRNHGKRKRSV